jgi:hypothetical protein
VEGGKVVEVMDSDELWQNKVFRQDLVKAGVLREDFEEPDDEAVPANPLKRVIIFTSKQQMGLFETCEKGSVDGNFKVAPTHFSQVFVMMLKFGEQWFMFVLHCCQQRMKSHTNFSSEFFRVVKKECSNCTEENNSRL